MLDYQDQLRRVQELEVRAVIAVESEPSDDRWVELCAGHDIIVTWPEALLSDLT